MNTLSVADFRKKLLCWYDRYGRDLPWRLKKRVQDPYNVWLSEIMLQQTTVQAVIPYYLKFIEKWPDVTALAAAQDDEVMHAWAGLGYYSRARNLLKCARVVVAQYGGEFPEDERDLLKLPGVGPYTAAAIGTIAFDKPSVVMDGNIERIASRVFRIEQEFPTAKPFAATLLQPLFCKPWQDGLYVHDFVQALMDLGATVCTPKSPKCDLCPLNSMCEARAQNCQTEYPKKAPKKKVETRTGEAYVVMNSKGQILLEKRNPKRMLGGMYGFPGTNWDNYQDHQSFNYNEGIRTNIGLVTHVFTHFKLKLDIVLVRIGHHELMDHQVWAPLGSVGDYALPKLFVKACNLVDVEKTG